MKNYKFAFLALLFCYFVEAQAQESIQPQTFRLAAAILDGNEAVTESLLTLAALEQTPVFTWSQNNIKRVREVNKAAGKYAQYEFDWKGNLLTYENGEKWLTFSYDKKGYLFSLKSFAKVGQEWEETENVFFYKDKDNHYTKVVKVFTDNSKPNKTYSLDQYQRLAPEETATTYDAAKKLRKLKSTKEGEIKFTYNSDGKLIKIEKLNAGTVLTLTNLQYTNGTLSKISNYQVENGDHKLSSTVTFQLNEQGLVSRRITQERDPNAVPEIIDYVYEELWQPLAATRGSEGAESAAGYGTPVVITWVNPEADQLVKEGSHQVELKLRPGVAQPMPEITNITLRHNHKLTEREIGNVVLRKIGTKDNYKVLETLELKEGRNWIDLEVETPLGKFNSGGRYVFYRNPKSQIEVKDLHVLSVGIDNINDTLSPTAVAEQAKKIASRFETEANTLFENVHVTTLTDTLASYEGIKKALWELGRKTTAEDLVVVFYAGAGATVEGNYMLLPYGTSYKEMVENEMPVLSNREFMEELTRLRCPVMICMDGKTQDENTKFDAAKVRQDYEDLTDPEAFDLRLLLLANEENQTENVDVHNNGVFADAILEGLAGSADVKEGDANGVVSFEELNWYVKSAVRQKTDYQKSPRGFKRGVGVVPLSKVE